MVPSSRAMIKNFGMRFSYTHCVFKWKTHVVCSIGKHTWNETWVNVGVWTSEKAKLIATSWPVCCEMRKRSWKLQNRYKHISLQSFWPARCQKAREKRPCLKNEKISSGTKTTHPFRKVRRPWEICSTILSANLLFSWFGNLRLLSIPKLEEICWRSEEVVRAVDEYFLSLLDFYLREIIRMLEECCAMCQGKLCRKVK